MSEVSGRFQWLSPKQAERSFQKMSPGQQEGKGFVSSIMSNLPELVERYEGMMRGTVESRRHVDSYLEETAEHLGELSVFGAPQINHDDLRQLGPLLARDATYREDAVFHVLYSRRNQAPSYLKPFVIINKQHMLQYGLAYQTGRLDVDDIQNDFTASAKQLIEPLVDKDEFQDSFMGSHMQRRVLRALYYILSEPSQSADRFLTRITRETENGARLSAEELIGRTYSSVNRQHEKHLRENPMHLETEETMISLLEGARLNRLRELGRSVLVEGLGIIAASEYRENEDE